MGGIVSKREHFVIFYRDKAVGSYYVFEDGHSEYSTSALHFVGYEDEDIPKSLKRSARHKKGMPFLNEFLVDENRVKGTRKKIYNKGFLTVKRDSNYTGERFWVMRRNAKKGEQGYLDPKDDKYHAPHYEGPNTPEGMQEWASWYCFNKMDDGTYEAELDEAWWWGGGHNDGGTMHAEIPEEWFELPYDEFLEKAVTLVAASHYNFTAQDLKEKEGLKEFFGFS
ncbi:MAG: hypothetical protein K6E85_15285 [Lachnospiraceae bacterium]|nr:hypothetical protein [Lachnospiraceae bacterium]